MDILEITQKVKNAKLIIDLPDYLDNQNVRVSIIAESGEEDWANLPPDEKVELLKSFIGKDKFPSIKVGKYDVYDQ